jgi:hypothetical protein
MTEYQMSEFELAGGEIRWLVHRNDPFIFSPSYAGLQLVNPLVIWQEHGDESDKRRSIGPSIINGDSVVFTTRRIRFHRDGSATLPPAVEVVENLVPSIIAALRAVSFQVHMRVYPDSGSGGTATVPAIKFPEAAEDTKVISSEVETAISIGHAHQAIERLHSGKFDIHQLVLMDALEAWIFCDYRRALVYSASAIEIAANTVIDETALAGKRGDDPVLKALPDRFGNLLHERMLYVAGRSLLIDAADLYKAAIKVYQTRNAIIHRGLARATDQIPLTTQGAKDALSIARRVFEWLGFQVTFLGNENVKVVPAKVAKW